MVRDSVLFFGSICQSVGKGVFVVLHLVVNGVNVCGMSIHAIEHDIPVLLERNGAIPKLAKDRMAAQSETSCYDFQLLLRFKGVFPHVACGNGIQQSIVDIVDVAAQLRQCLWGEDNIKGIRVPSLMR